MCRTDFDYYVEDTGSEPWTPALGAFCDCGMRGEPGNPVQTWAQVADQDDWDLCPICEGEEALFVVDDYGNETEFERRCWRCDGEGTVAPDGFELKRGWFCAQCNAARRLLDEWCEGEYGWGDIPQQIIEHWDEDELYQSQPFHQLVSHARNGWRYDLGRVDPRRVNYLVDRSLDAVSAA